MLFTILRGDEDLMTKITELVFYIIVIVVSFSFHEFAHAFTAHLMGDDTARNMGRMTLNPLAHIDPIGFVVLLVAGFGWAKPVPVNSRNYRNYRKGEFLVSFAGIFTNLIIMLVSALILAFLAVCELKARGFAVTNESIIFFVFRVVPEAVPQQLFTLFYFFCFINAGLAVFNLIPIFPLDGSHIFDLLFGKLLGPKVIMWMHRYGAFILMGLILVSNFSGFSPLGIVIQFIGKSVIKLFALILGAIF